uniref:Peptidase M12A domain-containing protein n=1 Tax=Cyprinus carpio TaxID=7962 RepID=A0A8C2AGM3_CYPCA
ELLHRANRVPKPDEPKLMDDIAVNERNADPCTSYGCLWPKYSDGKIYVPYVIANHYSSRELEIIQRGLDSFSYSTCIRFFPRSNERDYISIESRIKVKVYNFDKINTLNQGTPYDYSSVMQYERYAFSKNGLPTMVPIPNNNAALGTSTEMSQNDIIRINRLYQCCEFESITTY